MPARSVHSAIDASMDECTLLRRSIEHACLSMSNVRLSQIRCQSRMPPPPREFRVRGLISGLQGVEGCMGGIVTVKAPTNVCICCECALVADSTAPARSPACAHACARAGGLPNKQTRSLFKKNTDQSNAQSLPSAGGWTQA